MQIKKAILKVAGEVYVLADSSKFRDSYLSVICPIRDVSKVITDNEVSKENIKKAQEHEVPLVVAWSDNVQGDSHGPDGFGPLL